MIQWKLIYKEVMMQVLGSPFIVMKLLSEYFGYIVDVCPIEGDFGHISMPSSQYTNSKHISIDFLQKNQLTYKAIDFIGLFGVKQ